MILGFTRAFHRCIALVVEVAASSSKYVRSGRKFKISLYFVNRYVCEKNPRIALFGHFTTGVSDSLQDSLVNGNTQKLWNTHVIARTKLFSIRIETPGLPPATGNTPRRVPLPTMGNMKHSLFGLAQPRNAGPGQ